MPVRILIIITAHDVKHPGADIITDLASAVFGNECRVPVVRRGLFSIRNVKTLIPCGNQHCTFASSVSTTSLVVHGRYVFNLRIQFQFQSICHPVSIYRFHHHKSDRHRPESEGYISGIILHIGNTFIDNGKRACINVLILSYFGLRIPLTFASVVRNISPKVNDGTESICFQHFTQYLHNGYFLKCLHQVVISRSMS